MKYLPLLLLLSFSLFAIDPARDSTEHPTPMEHSITGYESYLDPAFKEKKMLIHLPFRDVGRLILLYPGTFYNSPYSYYSFGFLQNKNEARFEGMRVNDISALSFRSVGRLSLLSNETAIQLGDGLGGFYVIEAPEVKDSFLLETEFFTNSPANDFGQYDIDFNISSQIRFRKEPHIKRAMLPSFFFSLHLATTKDEHPSYASHYTLTESARDNLTQDPLLPDPGSNTFILNAETFTDSQFVEGQFRDAQKKTIGSFVKFIFPLPGNFDLSIGSYMQLGKKEVPVYSYELFNSGRYPEQVTRNFDNYARLAHAIETGKNLKIQQQFQFNYSHYHHKLQDRDHEKRFFDYGYIGSFDTQKDQVFIYGQDETTGLTGWLLAGEQDALVSFNPGNKNPMLANYTSTYYRLAGNDPNGHYQNLSQIQINNGLINGQCPRVVNGMWQITGKPYDSYVKSINREIGMHYMINLSLGKHNIKLGAEWNQSKQSSYQINPVSLWELMRLSANSHINDIDTEHPVLLINGMEYAYDDPDAPSFNPNDTILYNPLAVASEQTHFDRSLREQLGLPIDGTEIINTDGLDPEELNLELFNADELNNWLYPQHGIKYYGYDYRGNKISGQPSYRDYFYQKEANGNYTRPVKAFEPSYLAGFAEYQFTSKWVDILAGLRMDRYDANQPVLRDDYSLYAIRTAESVDEINGISAIHPANLSKDAAVYVDDVHAPTKIVGYRDGSTWYDNQGNRLTGPDVLAAQTVTGHVAPLLVDHDADIKSQNFDYDQSFKDYEPVINLLPHIQVSLKAWRGNRFYARYFAVSENPHIVNRFHPADFFYLPDFTGAFLSNSSLVPARADKFSAGIEQRLGNVFLGLSYYRHWVRNKIGIVNRTDFYPNAYISYANLPITIGQGLVLSFNYTSKRTSGFNAGVSYNPEFLSYAGPPGVSHIFNGYFQFNTGYGRDFIGPKRKGGRIALEGLGVGLFSHFRTGERYTSQANPTAEALIGTQRQILSGSVNDEAIFPFYSLDLKIEKGFSMANDQVHLEFYLWIQNLYGMYNIFNVYPYSGDTDDDGYLNSSVGQQTISSLAYPEAFVDQYEIKVEDPSFVDIPRIIRWGAVFRFY